MRFRATGLGAPDGPHLRGKVCVVTGITSGIGQAIARALGQAGAEVVGVSRDRARGEAALAAIGAPRASLAVGDLSSLASVRRCAAEIGARFGALHVLVNNAGGILPERRLTEDGIEEVFAQNHLGPFLLTSLLLDALRRGAPSRVVNVASEAHRRGHLDLDDPELERRHTPVRAYCNAKLATVLTTFELSRRLEGAGVTANCVHPGAVATGWGEGGGRAVRLFWRLSRPFFLDAEEGAKGPLLLAAAPGLEGVTARYFVREREAVPSAEARDPDLGRRIFDASAARVGLGAATPHPPRRSHVVA